MNIPSRAVFPGSLALLWVLLAHLPGCGGAESPRGLILVTIDTCRSDRVSAYDPSHCATPVIDSVAAHGVLFADVSAPAPLTFPSHCSILTGLYPDRHTARDNGADLLPEGAVTLAEILRDRGWQTGAFVAALPLARRFHGDQGFDTYDDDLGGGSGSRGGRDAGFRIGILSDQRTADAVVDAALPWLRDRLESRVPFFAWVHFFDPHAAYDPPGPQAARYGEESYEGEVAFVDEQIGRLLDGLGDVADDVVVAITADHGESLGEHGEDTHGFFAYEAALRVPWVLAGPGVPRGERVEGAVSLVQVLPTLLDVLDVPAPENLDGASALTGTGAAAGTTRVFAEAVFPRLHMDWAPTRSIRRGPWKLIEAPRVELYDLREDPGETRNLAAQEPELVGELLRELRRHADRGGRLDAVAAEIDDGVRERLEGLGYVGAGGESTPADELWDFSRRDPKDVIEVFNEFQKLVVSKLDGKSGEAQALLDDVLQRDPENPRLLQMLAGLQVEAEDWAGAREICRRIVALDPETASAWRTLGVASLRLGDTGEALRSFGRAVEIEPDDAATWTTLATLHTEQGDVSEAIAAYDRVLAIDPGRAAAVSERALLLARAGRPREAVDALRGVLAQDPDDLDALNNLAWILTSESLDPDEGFRHAQRAAQLAPDDPVVLDTLGWAAIRSGRPAEAVSPLTTAWKATGDAEVRAHLGIALAESGKTDEGAAHVRAALRERPSLAEIPEARKWNR